MPADDWSPGAAKSLLGAALLSQKRFAEAEAVLLEAQDDLETMSPARPDELMATIARLADLYATWGKRDEALKYRALLPTHATLGGRRARFDRLIAARGAAPARRRPVSAR